MTITAYNEIDATDRGYGVSPMHARITGNHHVILPEDDELAVLRDAMHILEDTPDDVVRLEVRNGSSVQLPASAVYVLRQVIGVLAHDRAVAVSQIGRRLTLDQVANILNLPLSHVTRLIDSGELAVQQVTDMPTVTLDELLTFIGARAVQRRNALDELTQLSEELGLYDLEE